MVEETNAVIGYTQSDEITLILYSADKKSAIYNDVNKQKIKLIMTTTEIKKLLYKQKPIAELLCIRKGVAYYDAKISVESEPIIIYKTIFFEIPVSDMGDADFTPQIEAQHLNRWIVNNENN